MYLYETIFQHTVKVGNVLKVQKMVSFQKSYCPYGPAVKHFDNVRID